MEEKLKLPRVFISYAREDQKQAVELAKNLTKLGVECRFDIKNKISEEERRLMIQEELDHCDYVIFLLSKNSIEKNGLVQVEKRYILDRLDYIAPGVIFLIPVRLEECEPKNKQFKKLHWVNLFPTWNNGLKEIGRALKFSGEELDKIQFSEPTGGPLTNSDYFNIILPTIMRWKKKEAAMINASIHMAVAYEYLLNLSPPSALIYDRRNQEKADLTISLSEDCMQSILDGNFDINSALKNGEIQLTGEKSLLKLLGQLMSIK